MRLRELTWLEKLTHAAPANVRVVPLGSVTVEGRHLPLQAFVVGSTSPDAPTFGVFAGVHGLERVGTQIALTWLESLFGQLAWDEDLLRSLEVMRIVVQPLVNPGGMLLRRRSNPAGVDLMRNAPVEAEGRPPFLLGGHRLGAALPFFRGPAQAEMQVESRALVTCVREHVLPARFALTLDLHSGFGQRDRLWYPWARSRAVFPDLPRIEALSRLLDETQTNHVYLVEPQSASYIAHGDLWDHLYLQHRARVDARARCFLPLTLEMGSWSWIRKNPRQLLSPIGVFDPTVPHRRARTMRRHLPLLEFLRRAVRNHDRWPSR